MKLRGSPFDLDDTASYVRWRDAKLAGYPTSLADLIVEVRDPSRLSDAEADALLARCRKANMAIYAGNEGSNPDKEIITELGRQFGLTELDHNAGADEDAITALTVQTDSRHQGYIPFSNRPIAWHTDGYYNRAERRVRGLILHCVQPADEGGENDLLDHEIAYLRLRDANPAYVRALMHPMAMTIPANVADGAELRGAQSGPVFSVAADGSLHMRYTDRSRSILWRDDRLTAEALAQLKELLHCPSPWHYRGKLQAGWGLLSNNVLHTRTRFTDREHCRLLYRARYYERIAGT
jgi:alpha-ketoglutarate-dependent taurine dioxygenase